MVKVRDDLPKTQDGLIDVQTWVTRILSDREDLDKEAFTKAVHFALDKGAHILTPYKESCFRRGLSIVEVLKTLEPDLPTLIAGLLLPCALYEGVEVSEIEAAFGKVVSTLIQGVMHVEQTQGKLQKGKKGTLPFVADSTDNLRRMLLAVIEDIRVVLIKLAERVAALRACSNLDQDISIEIAKEAHEIYAPLANRLGIGQIKWEIEDLAFRYVEPKAYKQIAKALDEKRLDRETYLKDVIKTIRAALKKEGIEGDVQGRVKHIYSIWRKMQRKHLEFSDIYDVRAVRILVKDVRDCYAALGVIHAIWQHIHKEFDDYIATPKENGYRSLHTAVIGPEGKTLEIQIRTFDMHEEAELGVAAHWIYKEGTFGDVGYQSKVNAIRKLLDESTDITDHKDYKSLLKSEFHDDRVYVFSPRGDVIDLPQGATPLDFAFEIHSELGYRCRGAKINGMMVPLTSILKSGDQVEVLAAKTGGPSRDWLIPNLGYIKSSKAHSKILSWFKRQDKTKHIEQGRDVIEREVKKLGLDKSIIGKTAQKLKLKSIDELYAGIGSGDLRLGAFLNALPTALPAKEDESLPEIKELTIRGANVHIQGVGNLLCSFAKCCKPLPGDPIVGYVTVGRGVTIHRKDCMNVHESTQEQRTIHVEWGAKPQSLFPVDIQIFAYDRYDLIRDLTSVLSNEKINLSGIHSHVNPNDNVVKVVMTVHLDNLEVLGKILTKMMQLPNVLEASRVIQEPHKK